MTKVVGLEVVPDRIKENLRLWTDEEVSKYLSEIAEKLVGKEFWDAHAIPIVISENKGEANAFYDPKGNYIAITRPMIGLFKHEDDIGFLLGHELDHYLKKLLGKTDNSVLQEGVADWNSYQRCAMAQYSLSRVCEFRDELLGDKTVSRDLQDELFDIHLNSNQRASGGNIAATAAKEEAINNDQNTTVTTEVSPELTKPVEYVSWVTREIKKRKIDEMPEMDKMLALIQLGSEVSHSGIEARKKEIIQYWGNFISELSKKYPKNETRDLWISGEHPLLRAKEEILKLYFEDLANDNPRIKPHFHPEGHEHFTLDVCGNFLNKIPDNDEPIPMKNQRAFWRDLHAEMESALECIKSGKEGEFQESLDLLDRKLHAVVKSLDGRVCFDNLLYDGLMWLHTAFSDLPYLSEIQMGRLWDKGKTAGASISGMATTARKMITTGIEIPLSELTADVENDYLRGEYPGGICFHIKNPSARIDPDEETKTLEDEDSPDVEVIGLKQTDEVPFKSYVAHIWPTVKAFREYVCELAITRAYQEKIDDLDEKRKECLEPENIASVGHAMFLKELLYCNEKHPFPTGTELTEEEENKFPGGIYSVEELLKRMTPENRAFWEKNNVEAHAALVNRICDLVVDEINSRPNSVDFWNISRGCYINPETGKGPVLTSKECFQILEAVATKTTPNKEALRKYLRTGMSRLEIEAFKTFVDCDLEKKDFKAGSERIFDPQGLSKYVAVMARLEEKCGFDEELPPLSFETMDLYHALLEECDLFEDKEENGNKGDREIDKLSKDEKERLQRQVITMLYASALDACINRPNEVPLKVVGEILNNDITKLEFEWKKAFGWCAVDAVLHKENFPESLVEFAKTANYWCCIFGGNMGWIPTNFDTDRINLFIWEQFKERLQSPHNPQEIIDAWSIAGGKFLLCDNISEEEFSKISDSSLGNMEIWNIPIKDAVAAYQKISDFVGTDGVVREKILAHLFDRIQKEPAEIQEQLLFDMMNDNSCTSFREKFENAWVDCVYELIGSEIDNDTTAYRKRLEPFITKIKGVEDDENQKGLPVAQQESVGRKLANKVVAQRTLAFEIKPIKLNLNHVTLEDVNDKKDWNVSALIKAEALFTKRISQDPTRVDAIIDFLNGSGSTRECAVFAEQCIAWDKKDADEQWSENQKIATEGTLKGVYNVKNMRDMYENYKSLTSEQQAVIMDSILQARIPNGTKRDDIWKQNFGYVMDRMFPNQDDPSTQMAVKFLYAYINGRENFQKDVTLSMLLVSAGRSSDAKRNTPEQNLAFGIRLFLEAMGPAGIKLGQALSIHPIVPDYIQKELAHMTSHADEPARWTLFEWMDKYLEEHPEERDKLNPHLGRILGSASYFVTAEYEDDEVVKLLRLGARGRSADQMQLLLKVLDELSEDKALGNAAESLKRIIEQALSTISIETNMEVGHDQLEIAKKRYPTSVMVGKKQFDIKIADWSSRGENWARMKKADGVELQEIQDPKIRKEISKAYFSVEMLNILDGGRFDHDRHPGQMKIDLENRVIGLFDTGAMALEKPTQKDLEDLGVLVFKTMENMARTDQDFGSALTEEMDHIQAGRKIQSNYLVEVQRGLLALSNYTKDFTRQDFMDCFDAVLNNPTAPVSKDILNGFTGEILRGTGLFKESETWSVQEKENMGRFAFNALAAIKVNGGHNIEDVLKNEAQKFPDEKLPLAGRYIKSKKTDLGSLDLKVPAVLLGHMLDYFKSKEVDPIVMKGMMKEAFESINIQDMQDRGTPEEKEQLGELLYLTLGKKHSKNDDPIKELKEKLKKQAETSELARNMYGLLALAEDQKTGGVDMSIFKRELLFSGNLNPDVSRGIQKAIRESSGGSMMKFFSTMAVKNFLTRDSVGGKTISAARKVFSLFKKDKRTKLQKTLENYGQQYGKLDSYLQRFAKQTSVAKENTTIQYPSGQHTL